jgi:HEAT repeats/PBS lyase HEAT-like repeat
VLPDGLLLDDRAPARSEQAIAELAVILHAHMVGELTVHPGGDLDAWRSFLLLVGRPSESVREEGGIARVWAMMAGRHVELREIDYTHVLRERVGAGSAVWDRIVANCLAGMSYASLDEETLQELLALAGDSAKLSELLASIDDKTEAGTAVDTRAATLIRVFRELVSMISKKQPEQLDPVLRNVATAVGELSPEMLLSLVSDRVVGDDEENAQVMTAIVNRMSDKTIAKFVARNVIADGGPTDRLAHAFQTLVRDEQEQQRLLALAHDEVAGSHFGSTEGFENAWNDVAKKLMTSYSDKPFVSDEYGRELSNARTKAVEVEQISDDPPERVSKWLQTVATSALRDLDLRLLLDLLQIEDDDKKWASLMPPVVALLEDLFLVGDFEAAEQLMAVLVREATGDGSSAKRQQALTAIDMLVAGAMMRHIVSHLATIDDTQFSRVKAMCVSLGEVLVRPLAEALSTEERSRPRERLTAILIGFGSVGQRTVERLKHSPNAAVRRTAIYLMREFGGNEALPDLTELLNDREPGVQREAVRAILNIATNQAYKVLERALDSGSAEQRDAIMQAIGVVRDERVVPLYNYIVRHVDHRRLTAIYLKAIESLGALRDPEAIPPLKDALYRGEWWAPRRTSTLRHAVGTALARIGTPEARAVLEEAIAGGTHNVRGIARTHLASMRAGGTPER